MSLYEIYNRDVVLPSDKQLSLIDKLRNTSAREIENFIPPKSSNDARNTINFLLTKQPITKRQKKVLSTIPADKIHSILKYDISIDKMTQYEAKRILTVLRFDNNFLPKIFNHPISSTFDYEYGWQEAKISPEGKLYYISFYELLMLDLDNVDSIDIESLEVKIKSHNLTARLYRTYNGYHVFITSHLIHHRTQEAWNLMSELNCDIYYAIFSYNNGFKVRLNPKLREDEYIASVYICTIGTEIENAVACKLLSFHDSLIIKHKK